MAEIERNCLGAFHAIWESWDESHNEVVGRSVQHFDYAIRHQLLEFSQAVDSHAAAREVIDIISVALNLLRWLGYQPHEIAIITQSRAEQRMKGKTREILDKYQKLYGY